MPVGGEIFAAGHYTTVWDSLAIGLMEGQQGSPTLLMETHSEPIDNTDAYGRTIIDLIDVGCSFAVQFTCLETQSQVLALMWPFDPQYGKLGVIGALGYDRAAPLVLTADALSPAAVAGPASLTASKTTLAENHSNSLLYGPTLRKTPIKLRLFPYASGPDVIFFATT